MKKLYIALMLIILTGSVMAISFYGDTSFKGYGLTNVSSITFTDGTTQSSALNFSGGNLTGINCITYVSGGMDCSG